MQACVGVCVGVLLLPARKLCVSRTWPKGKRHGASSHAFVQLQQQQQQVAMCLLVLVSRVVQLTPSRTPVTVLLSRRCALDNGTL